MKDIEQISNEFNNAANLQFTSLYDRYEDASNKLSRHKKGNEFQHLNNQYILTLKKQLEDLALSMMERYRAVINDLPHLQKMLSDQIKFYLNEFSWKSKPI